MRDFVWTKLKDILLFISLAEHEKRELHFAIENVVKEERAVMQRACYEEFERWIRDAEMPGLLEDFRRSYPKD